MSQDAAAAKRKAPPVRPADAEKSKARKVDERLFQSEAPPDGATKVHYCTCPRTSTEAQQAALQSARKIEDTLNEQTHSHAITKVCAHCDTDTRPPRVCQSSLCALQPNQIAQARAPRVW